MKQLLRRILFPVLSCLLLALLAACSSVPTPGGTPSSGNGQQGNSGGTPTTSNGNNGSGNGGNPTSSTQPMPQTSTSCPATGTARAMVTANLVLGNHNNIVYVVNEYQPGSNSTPKAGTLKRYDASSGAKTVIAGIPNVSIESAQVSADGKWILFTTVNSGQSTLQLVRMDGQGLQTLFCFTGAGIANPQWSSDQQHVIFSVFQTGLEKVYLLTIGTGNLQTAMSIPDGGPGQGVSVRTWLDNSRVYLTDIQVDQPPDKIYILNINNGTNQSVSSLPALVNKTFGDFDSSYDGSQLYVDYGLCGQGGCYPPSSITAQAATGGAQTTVLNQPNYDVTTVRAVTSGTLLLVINNAQVAGSNDISHNGLWRMKPDGSGLTRLTTDPTHQSSALNTTTQFPWSNLSRDSQTYALETTSYAQNNSASYTYTLEYGSLNGGSPTIFASISDGTRLSIAGWTTM